MNDTARRRQPSGAAVIRQDLTDALYRALFQEWAETGYAAISLENVAARAGAGKAAIYRRWPSKLRFAADALQAVGPALSDFEDHGSLQADLHAYLTASHRALRHPLIRRVLTDLIAERARSPELAAALDRMGRDRRQQGQQLLDRAIARGELREDLDRELALDMIPAALFWRLAARGKRIARVELDRMTGVVAAALKAC